MLSRASAIGVICCLVFCQCALISHARGEKDRAAFTQYRDPAGRFFFSYPATMTVKRMGPDHVKVYHSSAGLRINVFVENRRRRMDPKVAPLLAAFKMRLKQEMKGARILKEGRLRGSDESEGFVLCTFRDKRGIRHVQLVQYVVGSSHIVQMIISDRPEGFRNLSKIILQIQRSLNVVKSRLK
jgi:hypothetical protein